jgi:NAD(P) transhydrogenase
VCINTGTIPSKTLREAALRLSGYRERGIYGASYSVKPHITMRDLLFRVDHVISNEIDVARHQLMRNGVDILIAQASFLDPHRLRLEMSHEGTRQVVSAAHIIIAVGTKTVHDPFATCDGQHIFTCDDMLNVEHLPRSLAVVGAGVIGLEYACIFSALGVRVTLIDARPQLLPFVDREIMEALIYHLRANRAILHLGETVSSVESYHDDHGAHVRLQLASGKQVVTEKVLYSVGRRGATDELRLDAAGLQTDGRGRLRVNEHYQTDVPHIYAVGDVIGFSEPCLDLDGAGTAGCVPRVRRRHAQSARAVSIRDLHRARHVDGRQDRGATDGGRRAVRSRARTVS